MLDSLLILIKHELHEQASDFIKNNSYQYCTLQIPIDAQISLLATGIEQSFFLCKPDSPLTLLGLGSFINLEATGEHRFSSIKSAYTDILQQWQDKDIISPIAFHAFAFDKNDPMTGHWSSLPNTLIRIPLILFKEIDNQQTLFINVDLKKWKKQKNYISEVFLKIESLLKDYFKEINQYSDTTSESKSELFNRPLSISWIQITKKAINKIRSGSIDKIVTSRQFSLSKEKKISTIQLSRNLIKNYPGCTILSYQFSGKTIIVASPEHLITLDYPNIKSDAIGGTIHRKADKNRFISSLAQFPLEDKNRLLKEHDFIVQAIYHGLDSLCHTLKIPLSPFLMKLHNMYHLKTPIQGKLMDQYDLFDVVQTLHPTPAVAGYPTQQSRQWLLENENYQRGWYTGAFGYLENNSQGKINGELSVMLRCAVINKNKMTLFAGAGLVAESDPETEWQETELKMQTILEML